MVNENHETKFKCFEKFKSQAKLTFG